MSSSKLEVVVTGINGFVGEHLARHIKQEGHSVIGVGRDPQPFDKVASVIDGYQSADLLDKDSVSRLNLKESAAIIHLAGLAAVGESFDKPELYETANAEMTDNLLSVASDQGFNGRVVIVSSGAVYNNSQPMPLTEDSSIGGSSPYATGKIKAEQIALSYRKQGMDIVIARPFNHIGPGQGEGFLVPDLYEKLTKAVAAGEHGIKTGNLSSRRDFTDVHDITRAYALLALAPKLKEAVYNVSTGRSLSGGEILSELMEAAHISDIEPIQAASRPNDPEDIIGNSDRLKAELGWQPEISLNKTIDDFVADRQASLETA